MTQTLIDLSLNVEAELFQVDEATRSRKSTSLSEPKRVEETGAADEIKAAEKSQVVEKAEDDTWKKTGDTLKDRTDERIGQWNGEIDEYLTFVRTLPTVL